jgi:hypothetical protein
VPRKIWQPCLASHPPQDQRIVGSNLARDLHIQILFFEKMLNVYLSEINVKNIFLK